eukprot:5706659-Pyramimonas_sp.AAC.1
MAFLTGLESFALARGTINHLAALPLETAASSSGGDESPAAPYVQAASRGAVRDRSAPGDL